MYVQPNGVTAVPRQREVLTLPGRVVPARAIRCRISRNFLKQEANLRVGIQGKRLQGSRKEDRHLKVLLG